MYYRCIKKMKKFKIFKLFDKFIVNITIWCTSHFWINIININSVSNLSTASNQPDKGTKKKNFCHLRLSQMRDDPVVVFPFFQLFMLKLEKSLSQPAFRVRSTRTLVELYDCRIIKQVYV